MSFRRLTLGALLAGTVAAGGLAVASPAWAAERGDSAKPECLVNAGMPTEDHSVLNGVGSRSGCSDTVTYFWVRVYKVVDFWPDSEIGVKGSTYVQNGKFAAHGPCDGRGKYYTHTSTATGASGDSVESARDLLC